MEGISRSECRLLPGSGLKPIVIQNHHPIPRLGQHKQALAIRIAGLPLIRPVADSVADSSAGFPGWWPGSGDRFAEIAP